VELAERNEVMAPLRRCLDDVLHGEGRIVMVRGSVGMGKSAVTRSLAEEASGCGTLAFSATCSAEETELPLAVFGQLLETAPLILPERHRILGLLAEGMRSSHERVEPHLMHSLCTVLLELSERCPMLIVVDDLHHADLASQLCLSYLMRRIRARRVMVVLTYSDTDGHSADQAHAELMRLPNCLQLRLAPLTVTGLSVLAGSMGVEPRHAANWHALTGGNPSLVRAVIADHLHAADNYASAIQSCLRKVAPRLQSLVRGLAVLGHPEGLDWLTGLDAELVNQGLQTLERIGLLDSQHQFRHPQARSAVLTDMDGPTMTALHRSAAEVVFAQGASTEVVAEHLRFAVGEGGPWAVPVLAEAAHKALSDGRLSKAVSYLKLANSTCTDERRQAEIKTTLVRAEWQINPSVASGYLTELAEMMRGGHLRDGDAIVLAKALMWHGRFDDAITVLAQLAESGRLDVAAATEIEATRSWLRCTYPPMTAHLPDVTVSPGTPATAASVLQREAANALVAVLSGSDDAVPAMDHILRSSRLDGVSMDTVECALLAVAFGPRPQQGAQWCDAYIEEAATRMAPSRQARLAAIRAEISLRLGDLLGAERYARLGLRLMSAHSWGVALGAPISTLLRAQTALGKVHEAAELVATALPDAMLKTRYGLQYLEAVGHYHLVNGDLAVALRNFRTIGELMHEWSLDSPTLASWRLGAAEALLRMGNTAQACQLIKHHLDVVGSTRSRAHGIALRLLAATCGTELRCQMLREAAEILQEAGDRYELSRVLADLAVDYQRNGEIRQARTIRGQALQLAADCQAEPLIEHLSAEAGAQIRPEPGLLSDAERRVADLAVIGYTNREIAGRLFITVSTVEQHLTRIYRKLNVSRRSDLRLDLIKARQTAHR
jgi:DNA-binding CsgD family transcriptional regulator